MKSSWQVSLRGRAALGLRTLALGSAALLAACSQRSITVQLHPLRSSGDVSYVCRDLAGNGVPLSECNAGSVARGDRNLFALLTQTETGEVAVVNVPLDPAVPQPDEGFVDIDPSVPGFGFLHIGARPGHVVSSPGGAASFVGVAEAGKPGIYALPTSCISAPAPDQTERDLTTWSACSLPVAPGAITMVIDPPAADGSVAASCERADGPQVSPPPAADPGRECPADLTSEGGAPGRRKLLVSLPDLGAIWVLDAQSLLDRAPGEFRACKPEAELSLNVELPANDVKQVLPADLTECTSQAVPLPPPPATLRATPAGFSLSDGTLYVADITAPVVHAVDVTKPCAPRELPPLLARSLDRPDRVVTTSRVAVSPLTPAGKRYVYAIDQFDWPTASVMAFDVSPGSSDRTPIVRPGSPYIPFEAPDRIQFNAAPRDLAFVLRDRPEVDPNTGNVVVGAACDPDPAHSQEVGARYRPSADLSLGARSGELRGVFATVLLSNGQIAIVDVEDFDAACRRPISANSDATPDPLGCFNDPVVPGNEFKVNGVNTVTGEVSCNMVRPHRPRSTYLGITSGSYGVHAPSLGALPNLALPAEAAQLMPEDRPRMLATVSPDPKGQPLPAEVYVGTTLFSSADLANHLDINPATADRNSLVLPFVEPRAYAPANDMRLTYEGQLTPEQPAGFLDELEQDAEGNPRLRFHDRTIGFCDSGVQDIELMRELASTRFELSGERELATFGLKHSDYLVLSGDFPPVEDSYWQSPPAEFAALTRDDCVSEFGAFDAQQLSRNRDFTIIDAQQQNLLLAPRGLEDQAHQEEAKRRLDLARFCFPSAARYYLRVGQQWLLRGSASGIRHDIVPVWEQDANGQKILNCRRDCNPRKRFFQSRAFEISSKPCEYTADGTCYDACVLEDMTPHPVTLTEPAARCIHATATERFAIYRGAHESVRDMEFYWQTLGGFSVMRVDLSAISNSVSPKVLQPLPQFNWLSVVDAASLGLAQVSLDSLGILTPTVN